MADFSDALDSIKNGAKVHRRTWHGSGLWIEQQVPDEHSKMTVSYLYLSGPNGKRAPWTPSHADMFADDWQVFTPIVHPVMPYQQRVVDERAELDSRRAALDLFIGSNVFAGLDAEEQARLHHQAQYMAGYSSVLADRIDAFK